MQKDSCGLSQSVEMRVPKAKNETPAIPSPPLYSSGRVPQFSDNGKEPLRHSISDALDQLGFLTLNIDLLIACTYFIMCYLTLGQMLKQPCLKSSGIHLLVLYHNCWTYDGNIGPKLEKPSFVTLGA